MEAELLEQFKELDLNGDGFLTMEEMKTAFEKKGQKWDERDEEIFKEVDKNGDGKIAIEGACLCLFFNHLNLTNFSLAFPEWLKRFKDEVEEEILKELKKYKENLKAEMLKEFQALDENGDGFLTKDEIKSALKINEDKWGCFDEHYFTCLDENDDGKLSFEGKFYTIKIVILALKLL